MIKDCFKYDGVIKEIRLINGRVKVKLAANMCTQVASMGKYQPDAVPTECHKIIKVNEDQESFSKAFIQELSLISEGAPLSVFFNIDENDKTHVQLQI